MPAQRARIDPHVKVLDADVVSRAKAGGLDGIVYAPHFTPLGEIRRRAAAFSDDTFTVYPGREIFTGTWRHRRHVLALDLEAPVPDFITLDGALAALTRQDATILVPHPTFFTVSLSRTEIAAYRDQIDVIEVYNPKHWPHHTRRADRLAARHDFPVFGSSYAHLTPTVGEVWTTLERAVPDVSTLAAALADPSIPREIGHRDGVSHVARRGLEFAHLGWENSWRKFDRVVRSGREPTHPDAAVYEGRFDDVAVY